MSLRTKRVALILIMVSSALFLSACAAPSPATSTAQTHSLMTPTPAAVSAPVLRALTGLRPVDIAALLGNPDLRRDEPPAELWQYRAANCILNLFFYRQADGYHLVRAETWRRDLAGGTIPAHCRGETAPVRAHSPAAHSAL